MNKLTIVPEVNAAAENATDPASKMNNLDAAVTGIGDTIKAVPGAVQASIKTTPFNIGGQKIEAPTAEFKVAAAPYSVYNNLNEADQLRAQTLAGETNVRDDNTVTISTFGVAEQEEVSRLLDEALDVASQFTLDEALAATTEQLTKVIDTGLNLDLVYNDNDWLTNFMEKYLPSWFNRLNRFLRKTQSLRGRLAKIRKALMANGSELIGRMNLYDQLEDKFQEAIDDFYIYAASAELIYQREQAYLMELIKQAQNKATDGRLATMVKRQETTVFAVIKRMFYLLSQSLSSFLKVNVLEEGLRAASLAFGTVMEATYGAIDDLKAALAMILNQYRTAVIHQQALQVNHSALEALQKASELGKVSVAMMEKMTDEQKYAIGAYYKVGDDLVAYIGAAKKVMADMKQNYNDLGTAHDAVTRKVNTALAA